MLEIQLSYYKARLASHFKTTHAHNRRLSRKMRKNFPPRKFPASLNLDSELIMGSSWWGSGAVAATDLIAVKCF